MTSNNNIPQGYKQTDLGIIPEEWDFVNLGSISKINGRIGFRGYTVADLVPKGFGAITLSPSNIINGKINYEQCTYISWYKYKESPEIKVRDGDILLVKTGSTFGKSAFVKKLPQKATINPQFVLLNNFKCNNLYLSYVIAYDDIQMQINSEIVGGAIPTLSQEKIANFVVLLPQNYAEQKAIATALSDIDSLIDALDKKIEKIKLIKQGAMQQLLAGKKRLPGFTEEWVHISLEDLLEYEQPTKYIVSSIDYIENGIPVLTAGKTFILGYTAETSGIYTNIPVIIFDDFTTDNKFVTIPFKVKSSAMKILQIKDKRYNLRFIYEIMQLIKFPLYDHQRYWISEYSKLQIYIPTNFKEQQAIATILSDMDKEISDLETKRDKYHLIKRGMMQKLLTGQIRLK